MPINQILAPHYMKVKYRTPSATHTVRFYFETGSTLAPGALASPNDWTIRGAAAVQDVKISEVVDEMFTRARTSLPANTVVTSIELWQAANGPNLFLHNNDLPTTNSFGLGTGFASAYSTVVFSAANRQKYRLTFFDGAFVAPQRDAAVTPPTLDNNSNEWYVMRSLVPFATQDGHRINSVLSYNTGYNRKLARSYGRQVVP